ncbi:Hypothetical protein POVN_LOCUS321 [uncultured virus]|nr:Hypothetical protein POVN_LOCUS321 [uncultured virus]
MTESNLTVIWIRHGQKAYDNGKGPADQPAHDPPIAEGHTDEIVERGKELIRLYGAPSICIVSPYRRTRETATYLLSSMEEKKRPAQRVDVNIAEYLGNQQLYLGADGLPSNAPLVERETALYKGLPPVAEPFAHMQNRSAVHLDMILEDPTATGVIWIVSHGLLISTIARLCHRGKYQLWKGSGLNILEGFVLNRDRATSTIAALPPVPKPKLSTSNKPLKDEHRADTGTASSLSGRH